jgi:hypothetical protein
LTRISFTRLSVNNPVMATSATLTATSTPTSAMSIES